MLININNKGQLICTLEQYAVCYIVAMEQLNDKMPKFKYDFKYDLNIECGMNPETFRRCVNKFNLLLTGKNEDSEETAKEVLFPKLINAYNVFYELNKTDLYELAEKSFTDENQQIGLAVAYEKDAASKLYKDNFKKEEKEIVHTLHSAADFIITKHKAFKKTLSNIKEPIIKQAITDLLKRPHISNKYNNDNLYLLENRISKLWITDDKLKLIK